MNSSNGPISMPARAAVAQQPTGAIQMVPTSAPTSQQPGEQKAMRIRGGGASKDCFLGLLECFMCFECCKGICDCCGTILCCPCETVEDCCC
ncbi:hypothetical protein DFH11DRAFT_1594145 [Phellopilus nigrolimitatus]|nr:hypothetical protein DFH11DRAFT_1594145 [Phellopilus nigrolimitatus]